MPFFVMHVSQATIILEIVAAAEKTLSFKYMKKTYMVIIRPARPLKVKDAEKSPQNNVKFRKKRPTLKFFYML